MKVKCTNPKHIDSNPSMEVYENGSYCFSCGYHTSEYTDSTAVRKPPTDINKELEYIDGLEKREIRGLSLPADDLGYYITWPDRSYYKKRLYEGKARYIGPRGHRAPLYRIPGVDPKTLVVVEGEINAITLSNAIGNILTIVSPGSATELTRHIALYKLYSIVYIVIDRDIPGVINGLKLKDLLLERGRVVHLVAKEKDYNQILQEEGSDRCKEEAYRDLGLSGRL